MAAYLELDLQDQDVDWEREDWKLIHIFLTGGLLSSVLSSVGASKAGESQQVTKGLYSQRALGCGGAYSRLRLWSC